VTAVHNGGKQMTKKNEESSVVWAKKNGWRKLPARDRAAERMFREVLWINYRWSKDSDDITGQGIVLTFSMKPDGYVRVHFDTDDGEIGRCSLLELRFRPNEIARFSATLSEITQQTGKLSRSGRTYLKLKAGHDDAATASKRKVFGSREV
jgi:hypothetical protein